MPTPPCSAAPTAPSPTSCRPTTASPAADHGDACRPRPTAVIAKGIDAGERVVTTGFARLKDGRASSWPRPRSRQPRPTGRQAATTMPEARGTAGPPAPPTCRSSAPASSAAGAPRLPAGERGTAVGGLQGARPRRARRQGTRRRRAQGGRQHDAMSVSVALHPAADRHLAAGLRRRCWAARSATGGCRSSSLPQVDFPTIQVTTQLPGANPETTANLVTAPLERQLGQIPALATMTSSLVLRHQPDHAAVRAQPRHRRRRAGRAVGHQCGGLDAAAQPALSADLRQGEPGRRADRHAGADLADHLAAPAVRSRRHADGAAPELGAGRRPRLGRGRHPAGGAHPGRSVAARLLRPRAWPTCARPSSRPTSPAPRARSTARIQSYTIAANDQITSAEAYSPSSSPTATTRRCC